MAKLIYSAITSLDGYTADKNGNFDWAEPDEEVHTFVNACRPGPLKERVATLGVLWSCWMISALVLVEK